MKNKIYDHFSAKYRGTNGGLPFHRLSLHGKYRNVRELRSIDSESRTLQSLKNQKYSRKGSNLKSKEGNKVEFEEIAQKQERGKNKPPSRRDTRENHLPAIAAFGGRAPQWRPPCPEHSSGSNNHKPWAGDMALWARALAALQSTKVWVPAPTLGRFHPGLQLSFLFCGRLCSPACTHTPRKRETDGWASEVFILTDFYRSGQDPEFFQYLKEISYASPLSTPMLR